MMGQRPHAVGRDRHGLRLRSRLAKLDLSLRVTQVCDYLLSMYGDEAWYALLTHYGVKDALSSDDVRERLQGLQVLLFGEFALAVDHAMTLTEIVQQIEERIVHVAARKQLEEQIERRVAREVTERQNKYWNEIRKEILQPKRGSENGQTLKMYAQLEKKEHVKLGDSLFTLLRPRSVDEIIGQENGVRSLLAKLASPFPQHILVYGPPGVGKTSAARLALQIAASMQGSRFQSGSPFVEVDATTLRMDVREATNPLLGSVHDPIYQGTKRDYAERSVPEPKLGLVTEAHGGVLFIDEIGELEPGMQLKLLKVLEDKRVHFQSAYYDPDNDQVPLYIRKLFSEGAPADFVLVGATTRDPADMLPALRSRCAEVFFDPLRPEHIERIVTNAAERLQVHMEPGVPKAVSQFAMEGRKAVGILADAYADARLRIETHDAAGPVVIRESDVLGVTRQNRIHVVSRETVQRKPRVGHVHGLGVSGYVGCLLEFEAVAFPARSNGAGQLRFNETAGTMTKDSVFNAITSLRQYGGIDVRDYDVHINIVGGGQVDGPSAGVALCLVLYSAICGVPIMDDIAYTGEISLQGEVRPVGGIPEKIYGACQSGIRTVYVPAANEKEVPEHTGDAEVRVLHHISDLLPDLSTWKEVAIGRE